MMKAVAPAAIWMTNRVVIQIGSCISPPTFYEMRIQGTIVGKMRFSGAFLSFLAWKALKKLLFCVAILTTESTFDG